MSGFFHFCHKLISSIALIALLLLGSCKIGPNYTRPEVKLAPAWQEAGDKRLDNVRPPTTAPGGGYSTTLPWTGWSARPTRRTCPSRSAGVRVIEAWAQLGVATGQLYPQTQQLTGSVWRYHESAGTPIVGTGSSAPRFGGLLYWQSQLGITASWEIDFWGKFRRAIESADASLQANIANYDSTLVTLTANVANYYIAIRTLEKRLDIARQNVATQKESLQIARTRFEGGTTSQRDVEQARSQLANTQATVPVLMTQLSQAKNALSVLLGMAPSGQIDQVVGKPKPIPAPPPQIVIGIPADLLRRRPDVREAEYNAIAQVAQIGVAKADLLPAFSLTGTFGPYSTNVGKNTLAEMFRWANRQGYIGPAVSWNFLNYGRLINQVRVQDARFQELLITYQNTVLSAQQDVEDNLTAFLRTQEQAAYLADKRRGSPELA